MLYLSHSYAYFQWVQIRGHTYTHARTHACAHTCMHTHAEICLYICSHTYHIHKHIIHTNICICISTHTINTINSILFLFLGCYIATMFSSKTLVYTCRCSWSGSTNQYPSIHTCFFGSAIIINIKYSKTRMSQQLMYVYVI